MNYEQYGKFSNVIEKIDTNFSEIQKTWTDEVFKSMISINDNFKTFSFKIWNQFDSVVKICDAIQKNYNESEIEEAISNITNSISNI